MGAAGAASAGDAGVAESAPMPMTREVVIGRRVAIMTRDAVAICAAQTSMVVRAQLFAPAKRESSHLAHLIVIAPGMRAMRASRRASSKYGGLMLVILLL
jgi:hypothetical protein